MTDEIKKMLEPCHVQVPKQAGSVDLMAYWNETYVKIEDFERLKRGFLKLMEQRNKYIQTPSVLKEFGEESVAELIFQKDVELKAVMKGEG